MVDFSDVNAGHVVKGTFRKEDNTIIKLLFSSIKYCLVKIPTTNDGLHQKLSTLILTKLFFTTMTDINAGGAEDKS